MISRQSLLLLTACAAVFIEALDIAIINLAIPLIQKSFVLTNQSAQWLQSLYVLVYGGLLLVGGKLSDTVGRKKIFLSGAALFLITSMGAGLSPDFDSLLIFRALQGLAAALLMPSALSIITNAYTDSAERSKAIGLFSAFAAIGSGSGLSVGGLIASSLGWQWVFLMNVPLIAGVGWLGYSCIPTDSATHAARGRSPDLLSAVLLTAGILLLSYAVHQLARIRENVLSTIVLVMAIGVCAILFVYRNRRLEDPLIRFALFRNRFTVLGNGVSALLGAVFTGYLFIISIILQNNMGYSAAKAGLLLFPFSILSALVSKFLLPALMKRTTIIQSAITGMSLLVCGALALFGSMHFSYNLPFLLLSAVFTTGCGISIAFPSLTVMSVQNIPSEHHGLATSLVATSYFLGGGIGLSLLSLFMQSNVEYVTQLPVVVLGLYAVVGVVILTLRRVKVLMC